MARENDFAAGLVGNAHVRLSPTDVAQQNFDLGTANQITRSKYRKTGGRDIGDHDGASGSRVRPQQAEYYRSRPLPLSKQNDAPIDVTDFTHWRSSADFNPNEQRQQAREKSSKSEGRFRADGLASGTSPSQIARLPSRNCCTAQILFADSSQVELCSAAYLLALAAVSVNRHEYQGSSRCWLGEECTRLNSFEGEVIPHSAAMLHQPIRPWARTCVFFAAAQFQGSPKGPGETYQFSARFGHHWPAARARAGDDRDLALQPS
jgi:hypothetical protein